MTARKILLRIVFGSLAMAAGFGAAGVIFAGHDTLWRIVGTCAATAVGALLLLGSSTLLEREEVRQPGAMSVVLVVAEYVLTLGLIWELFHGADDQAGLTALFLALTGFPALVFLGIMRRPGAAVAARVGLAACATSFLLFMIGTWSRGWGHRDFRHNHWFEVGSWLAPFALLAVFSLVGTGLDRRHWRWAGVAAAAAGFSITTYAIVLDIHETSSLFVCIVSVAIVVAHANAMMLVPLASSQRWLLWGTLGAAITSAVLVDVRSITSPWEQERLGRLAGAAAIIAGCGTLALLVLARINRRASDGRRRGAVRECRQAMDNPYVRLTHELNSGRLRAILASGQAVVLYRLAIMSKDGDWILREDAETLGHVIATLAGHGARYRFGAPLDLRWLAHGWSSHLEFQEQGLRLRCDFVTRPPRVSPSDLQALWEAPVQKEAPVVGLPLLAELKKTNREKDYAVIGELARRMDDPGLEALYSRSARDLIRLHDNHPAIVAKAAAQRPLLSRLGEGREEVERLLDEERRRLMRLNEERLDRYVRAASSWGAEWPRLSREIAGRPLPAAHDVIVARAAELLPEEP